MEREQHEINDRLRKNVKYDTVKDHPIASVMKWRNIWNVYTETGR